MDWAIKVVFPLQQCGAETDSMDQLNLLDFIFPVNIQKKLIWGHNCEPHFKAEKQHQRS